MEKKKRSQMRMHFERENPCSQVEYNYSFDYKQEMVRGLTWHRELWLAHSLIALRLSTLMALLFALGSLTFVTAICACQLRPAWLSFHKFNCPTIAYRQPKSRLIDNQNQGFGILLFGLTHDNYLKENKYKQDTGLRFVLPTSVFSCVCRLLG